MTIVVVSLFWLWVIGGILMAHHYPPHLPRPRIDYINLSDAWRKVQRCCADPRIRRGYTNRLGPLFPNNVVATLLDETD